LKLPRHLLIPLIVACALFMENIDSTIIATSLPAIAKGLGEHPLSLNLGLTSYLVSLAVFIPVSGWVADRVGSRTVFIAAMVVFMTGSLLCAASHSLGAFVAARFFQGLGGAMMVPVGRMVLLKSVPKSELVLALNYLTTPALVGPVIGPALGGLITLYFNWRWIFLINVPICVLGLVLAVRYIPNYREDEERPLDLRGFVLSGVGLASLMLGLSTLGRHLLPWQVALGLLAGGVLVLAVYGRHSRRVEWPLIDLRLLRSATLRAGVVGGSLFRAGAGATPFLLPLMLQLGFGLNPFQSGLITCFTAVGAMFMKTFTVYILRRFGFRSVMTSNALLASVSLMAAGLFTVATPHLLIMAVLLLSGCMRSLQFTALNAISYADVGKRDISDATALSSMAQRLSQSVGITLGALALQVVTLLHHRDAVQAEDFPPAFVFVGLVSMLSMVWLLRLPGDAGAEISGQGRPAR
jgi:EmrB/QacA subfamily drug resistance transporter